MQRRHHLIGGHDPHLQRQQQRGENHPEQQRRKAEAEIDQRIGRHHRQYDFSDREAQPHDHRIAQHQQPGHIAGKPATMGQHLFIGFGTTVAGGEVEPVEMDIDARMGRRHQRYDHRRAEKHSAKDQDQVVERFDFLHGSTRNAPGVRGSGIAAPSAPRPRPSRSPTGRRSRRYHCL